MDPDLFSWSRGKTMGNCVYLLLVGTDLFCFELWVGRAFAFLFLPWIFLFIFYLFLFAWYFCMCVCVWVYSSTKNKQTNKTSKTSVVVNLSFTLEQAIVEQWMHLLSSTHLQWVEWCYNLFCFINTETELTFDLHDFYHKNSEEKKFL